jgi:hypothetical protein
MWFQSLVLGIIIKLYDDITDGVLSAGPVPSEILKSMIVGLTSIVSLKHPGCLIMIMPAFLAAATADFFCKTSVLNDPFWYALFAYVGFLGIYTGSFVGPQPVLVWLTMIIIGGAGATDAYYFPEEASDRKFLIRAITVAALIVFLSCVVPNDPATRCIAWFGIGYMGTSLALNLNP